MHWRRAAQRTFYIHAQSRTNLSAVKPPRLQDGWMHTQHTSSRNRACRLRGIPRRDQHAVLIKPKFPDQGQQSLGKLMELSCSSRGCHRQARVLARGPAGIAQAQPQLQDAAALPAAALPKLGSPGSCCVLGPHPSPLQQLLPLPSCRLQLHKPKQGSCVFPQSRRCWIKKLTLSSFSSSSVTSPSTSSKAALHG